MWLWAISAILGLSGFLVVMEALGFLPARMSKYLNRNRLAQTLEALQAMGVDVESIRKKNTVVGLPEKSAAKTIQDRVKSRLDHIKIKGPLLIGNTEAVVETAYINLMGATSEPAVARQFARDLAAHWRNLIESNRDVANYDIDFIVTPKSGSPLLGYELAQILGKPFAMYSAEPKFRKEPQIAESHFDCWPIPSKGSRALLVDDSSTGGGKAIAAVKHLRGFGFLVSDFLVVFEPLSKVETGQNAENRLKSLDVNLHSILKT